MGESRSTTTPSRTQTEPSERYSSVEMFAVEPDSLDEYAWDQMHALLSGIDGVAPDVNAETLIESVKNEESDLWILLSPDEIVVGAIVMRPVDFDTGYSALWVLAGVARGTRLTIETMRKLQAEIEGIALKCGCDGIRFVGGRHWGRILTGFTETGRVYDKRLTEVH